MPRNADLIKRLLIKLIWYYVFCPRRFYYESVEGHQVVNDHIEEGKIKHEHVHTAVTDRKKGDKTVSRRQYLASDAPGCLWLYRPC